MEQKVFDLNSFYEYESILQPGFEKTGYEKWHLWSHALKISEKIEILIACGFWIDSISSDGTSEIDNIIVAHRLTIPEIRDNKINQIIN